MTKFSDNQIFDGIRKFQKDNRLKVDGIMKPSGETESFFNKLLQKGEYLSSAAQQGLSLGWSDEIKGALGGIGYGLGSLKPEWNKTKESFSQAVKRGYQNYRDRERHNLEAGRQEMPVSSRLAEAAGAFASPSKLVKSAKTAPLRFAQRKNLLDMVSSSIVYGAGVSDHKLSEYAKNIGLAAGGNALGYKAGNQLYGRGSSRSIERAVISEVLNEFGHKAFYSVADRKRK